ncbi:hypothetical protein E2C01_030434 [Portunus trituberculatus]|uniref:Uncharacterized protein n=1 Tax=Portunus trituberculatus TaxID=210409 RepID=A0A5B7EVQ3_PORTR|nr:hypothetical protein [Portunus trituberculatus]
MSVEGLGRVEGEQEEGSGWEEGEDTPCSHGKTCDSCALPRLCHPTTETEPPQEGMLGNGQ